MNGYVISWESSSAGVWKKKKKQLAKRTAKNWSHRVQWLRFKDNIEIDFKNVVWEYEV
jgi:hypothetical protein